MSLAPKFHASHVFPQSSTIGHSIELYLDYACRFSAKIYKNWYDSIFPLLESKYNGKVKIIFKNYVQTWHPNSTLLHEAGLIVSQLQPEIFWKFSYKLFDEIKQFYDTETIDLNRNQIYDKIYDVVIANDESYKFTKDEFLKKLYIVKEKGSEPSNGGNQATNDLKYFTKIGRQNGIHVTPTVVVDGFKDGSIESSTPIDEILKKFDALI